MWATVVIVTGLATGAAVDGRAAGLGASGVPPDAVAATQPQVAEPLDAAFGLIQAQRYDEAREALSPVLEAHPDLSRAHFLVGLSYHKERRFTIAEEHLRRAAERDAADPAARFYLGECLYNLGRLDEARRLLEGFVAEFPEEADGHFALGQLELAEGKLDAAADHFRASAELAERRGNRVRWASALVRWADVDVLAGRLEDAKGRLLRAVEVNPELYGAYFKLARVLTRLGDHEGAAKAMDAHRRLRPAGNDQQAEADPDADADLEPAP